MNLSAMQTAVYNRLSVDSSDGLMTPASIVDFINQANHQISGLFDWPWLQSAETIITVPGQDSYVPGSFQVVPYSNWYRTVELVGASPPSSLACTRVLERYSMTELDDRWIPFQRGSPVEWAIWADKLVLRPVPDGIYPITHRYIFAESDLVNPTDSPILPSIHHFAIVELATYVALRRDRNDARAATAEAAYMQWKTEQLSRATKRFDLPGRIRIRPGGWT